MTDCPIGQKRCQKHRQNRNATANMISDQALSLAQTLVRMDTISRNSNLGLIHFVRDYLAVRGVASRLTYNADKTKANLFATLGEGKPAGLILSGHTDTVPWDGQDWTHDPLGAQVHDGKLYGRGSADMKSYIAIALSLTDTYLTSNAPFALHFAFSFDEEIGCVGVRHLIADMKDQGIRPLACIIGEPTDMVPAIAHKGVFRYTCCVKGKEAHSSLTNQSVNAIAYAARVIGKLNDLADRFEHKDPHFPGFDVPYTTTSVGRIEGGIADNVVPLDCMFRYEFRNLPGVDIAPVQAEVEAFAKGLEPRMKAVHPQAGFSFEQTSETPSFLSKKDEPVTQLALRLTGAPDTTLVAFGTEAGLFQRAGVPTVVCGPGSIVQAHQPDEFVSLEQLGRCEAMLRALAGIRAIA
jgi:acetylornithine deacetylase